MMPADPTPDDQVLVRRDDLQAVYDMATGEGIVRPAQWARLATALVNGPSASPVIPLTTLREHIKENSILTTPEGAPWIYVYGLLRFLDEFTTGGDT